MAKKATFKPMLAGKAPADLAKLKFPVYVSPKLDGIRCLVTKDGPVSRKLKRIKNHYIFDALFLREMYGFDGELIVGKPTGDDVWNRSQSGVMSEDGDPDFTFYVFDNFAHDAPFVERQRVLAAEIKYLRDERVVLVEQIRCDDVVQLKALEERYVDQGYEGVMVRSPLGPYKFGRSTTREGHLLKVKRFEDYEAAVVGMVERMHNGNEAKTNALGHTERSTKKAGKVGTNMMGALECVLYRGDKRIEFELGTGFTEAQRK